MQNREIKSKALLQIRLQPKKSGGICLMFSVSKFVTNFVELSSPSVFHLVFNERHFTSMKTKERESIHRHAQNIQRISKIGTNRIAECDKERRLSETTLQTSKIQIKSG